MHKRKALTTLLRTSAERGAIKLHLLQIQIFYWECTYWECSLVETQWAVITFDAVMFVCICLFLRFHYGKHCIYAGKSVILTIKGADLLNKLLQKFQQSGSEMRRHRNRKKVIAQHDGGWYNSLISKNWSKERWSLSINLFNTFIV